MKRFLPAIALACVLSVSALAGDMPTSGFAPPPPDEPTETASTTLPSDIPSDASAETSLGDEVIVNVLGILCGLAI